MRRAMALAASLLLAACASQAPKPHEAEAPAAAPLPAATASAAASPASARTRGLDEKKFAEAVTAPLADLNLIRAEIPEALAAAVKAPYGVPADGSCSALATEVRALDAALGADLDTPATASNPSLIERGTNAAGDALIGALRNTTEGVIPFRGWVRKLTGAERYAKEVAAAIAAGTIRRAYLKGLGQAAGCAAPAAPKNAPAKPPAAPATPPGVPANAPAMPGAGPAPA